MRILLVLALAMVLAAPAPAWAYIDPGTSSIAYQVLIAGALAIGFAVRLAWHKVAAALKLCRSSPPSDGPVPPE